MPHLRISTNSEICRNREIRTNASFVGTFVTVALERKIMSLVILCDAHICLLYYHTFILGVSVKVHCSACYNAMFIFSICDIHSSVF